MNLNASPTSPFPIQQINHDHNFDANFQVASSSSSTQDQTGYRQKDEDYAYHGGSSYNYEIKNGLKLTLWKKDAEKKKNNPVKWMSSKMRLMRKMKNNPKISTSATNKYFEDHKFSLETDIISSYNNNSPIRVCADCNTTKTPLWRSGPKGPKSLCNACGIRQRKARRAMVAAASRTVVTSDQPPPTQTPLKIKVKNVHFKKMASTTSSNGKKKNIDLEDFLINLSNKLTFHRVFPDEEKDAAILLMALSSGLVHG